MLKTVDGALGETNLDGNYLDADSGKLRTFHVKPESGVPRLDTRGEEESATNTVLGIPEVRKNRF